MDPTDGKTGGDLPNSWCTNTADLHEMVCNHGDSRGSGCRIVLGMTSGWPSLFVEMFLRLTGGYTGHLASWDREMVGGTAEFFLPSASTIQSRLPLVPLPSQLCGLMYRVAGRLFLRSRHWGPAQAVSLSLGDQLSVSLRFLLSLLCSSKWSSRRV